MVFRTRREKQLHALLAAILIHGNEPLAPHHRGWIQEALDYPTDDELQESVARGNPRIADDVTPLTLAIMFHDEYERLAPTFGYKTRAETRQFDAESANEKLMIAVCAQILDTLRG